MKKITLVGFLFSLLFTFSEAKAALLLEPVGGYIFSSSFSTAEEGELTDNVDIDGRGPSYGGRIGHQYLGFQIGLDYLRSYIDLNNKDYSEPLMMNEFAGFIGFEFPVFFRVYGGYIFAANAETELKEDNQLVEYTGGSGMKLGFGFTGLPLIDINLEFRRGRFRDYTLEEEDKDAPTDYNIWMVALSMPLTF